MNPKDPFHAGSDPAGPEDPTSTGAPRSADGLAPTEAPGDATNSSHGSVGPYRLLQRLGEGGMGEVWEAEQSQPVRRRVALKVIKAGMDSQQVIGRFEAERQALALMDHPAIAKVFDAGTTPAGRPFFAMELVRGEPIDRFCDRHRLTTRERLDLFLQVCAGIEHAHQKGIIHRDLKPSNLLVALRGEVAEPKIIDFGVAKATQHRLTESTMVTELGVLIGTPEYMSPEQAELTGLDVDTRTDVYALGVILYELLVGVLPFDSATLRRAGFDEIRRVIREDEPVRPSTRVSTLGDGSAEATRSRRTDLPGLRRQLRGDLDWITMKALDKDRRRRYGSATELAADIRRHLQDEPVLAGPPGAAYRARKFVRRHRLGVAAAGLVLAALLAGLGAATWGLVRARRAETRARQEAATARSVTRFLTSMFQSSNPYNAQERDITVREVLDRGAERLPDQMRDQPQVRARMLDTMGVVYDAIGLYDEAAPLLEEATRTLRELLGDDAPETLDARRHLAWLRFHQGRFEEADRMMSAVLEVERSRRGDEDPVTMGIVGQLGYMYMDEGRYDEAEPLMEASLEWNRRVHGEEHLDTVWAMIQLNWLYRREGRYDEAEKLATRSFEISRKQWGDDGPTTLISQMAVGLGLVGRGRHEEAERILLESLERKRRVFGDDQMNTLYGIDAMAQLRASQARYAEAEEYRTMLLEGRRRTFGPEHFETIGAMSALAAIKMRRDQYAEAESLAREAVETGRRALGEEHPATRSAMNNLAVILWSQGRYEAAAGMFEELLAVCARAVGEDRCLDVVNNLANTYSQLGREAEAVPLYEKALEIHRRDRGDEHSGTLMSMNNLATSYSVIGRVDEAEALLREALDTKRRAGSDGDLLTIYLLINLAVLHDSSGLPEDAVKPAEEAVELARRLLGEDAADTASAEVALAEVYAHLGRGQEAVRLCTAARKILADLVGREHPSTLDADRILAGVLAVQGRLQEAEQLYDRVIEAQTRVLGPTHRDLMSTFYSRALLSATREEWHDALAFLRRAVEGGWAQRRIYTEPVLAPLRGDAGFQAIVATVRDKVGERSPVE